MTRATGISVLHVDDDSSFAALTAAMLSRQDAQFTVETATSASEGLDKLSAGAFDCLVSDYDMPGCNGIDFLETVRADAPDMPFILYTGKGSEAVASDAIAAGVTDYLQKESGTSQYTVLANKIRNAVETRRQQERARATRDRLRQIIDMLPQLVSVKDEAGEFLLANEAAAEAYGTTVSDLKGATDADVIDSEAELEQFRADDRAVIESGEPKHIPEELLTTADDETRLLETTKIPYDPVETDGNAVLGVSRDITERKEREHMLQQYQYVYESALSGIAIVDPDGELIDVNPTFLDMWGYDDEDDVIGRLATDLWKDHEQASSVLETVDERGRWEGELEAVRADGSTFYARGVNSHLTDIDGNPIGVVSSFFDITERKRREAELEMQSTAMEAAMDGISILNERGEYIYMNQAHADVFGYDADELLGSTWRRLYGDDESVRIEQEVFSVLDDTGEWRGETVGKCRDGSPVYQEITLSLLDDGKLICTNRDITERKEREQELRRTNTVLRTIVKTLPMGVLVEDAERDVLVANDLLGETLGMPIDGDELAGRDCAATAEELKDLFADPAEFIDGITERIERREPLQNEELTLKDGRVIERDYVPYTLPEGDAHLWLYRDVTERKQQQRELNRSRQFLQDVQQVAHIGGWELDIHSESLRWSDEMYRIHGSTLDADVTIEDAFGFYHPEDRDTIREAFDRLTAEGTPYDLELRIVTADDDVRWVNTIGEPVYEDGEIVAAQGTFQDITERKERERELRMVRERFERFAANVQDAFFLLPTDYSETEYANPAVEAVYGITREEAYDDPMAWLRHVHPDDTDELLTHIETQQKEATDWPLEQEFRIEHPHRGTRWVQARLDVIADENGDPSRLTGVTTDITERIRHERQLEEKTEQLEQLATKYESQYRTLFEEAPVMTVLTRSEDGRPIIEDCNSQFVETLGYDADAIIDSELPEFYTAESAERLQSQGYSQALDGEFTTEKRDLMAVDGEVTEAILRAVPRRTADGEIIGTVAMYIDITERESVKRANERLEEFTSVVSHDLRNPLNVAQAWATMLQDQCDDEAQEHLEAIMTALERMESITEDTLALARQGHTVAEATSIQLTGLIEQCWEGVETAGVTLEIADEFTVRGDRGRLRHIFENLFRNAVEHGGADVTVRVERTGEDCFCVEDDGPGIHADDRERVFEAGHTSAADGTGFGLTIVKRIAEAHGWGVRIIDGRDGGARFEFDAVEIVGEDSDESLDSAGSAH